MQDRTEQGNRISTAGGRPLRYKPDQKWPGPLKKVVVNREDAACADDRSLIPCRDHHAIVTILCPCLRNALHTGHKIGVTGAWAIRIKTAYAFCDMPLLNAAKVLWAAMPTCGSRCLPARKHCDPNQYTLGTGTTVTKGEGGCQAAHQEPKPGRAGKGEGDWT